MRMKINNRTVGKIERFALMTLKNAHAIIDKVFDAKNFYLGTSIILLSIFISPVLDVFEHVSRHEKVLYFVFKTLLICLFWYGVVIILISFFIYKK